MTTRHIAAGVGELLRPVAIDDVGACDAHDSPVEEAQDGGVLDVRHARHRRHSGHVRETAEVVEQVYGEGAVLAVVGDEVEARASGKLDERWR